MSCFVFRGVPALASPARRVVVMVGFSQHLFPRSVASGGRAYPNVCLMPARRLPAAHLFRLLARRRPRAGAMPGPSVCLRRSTPGRLEHPTFQAYFPAVPTGCAAMDFHPTATPTRLALGEIRLHVRFNHTLPPCLVDA